ncbi:hypothetical protein Q1695_003035 [Nippostrongylus brasiliensis]|nr:hypothetical protein Q1695_003035 [Nippostrongylus brasiliensis]
MKFVGWCPLVVVISILYVLFAVVWPYGVRLTSVDKLSPTRCLVASLHATEDKGGIGNVMFELLGFISIAKRLKRMPVISDHLYGHLQEIFRYFPQMRYHFKHSISCKKPTFVYTPLEFCCRYDNRIVKKLATKAAAHSIAVKLRYLQAYNYLTELDHTELYHAVRGSNEAISIAENELFPLRHPNRKELNICVHIRRGDFTNSTMHLASDYRFAIQGMKFAIEAARKEDSRAPHIYIFTDNANWTMKQVVEPYLQTVSTSLPPQIASPPERCPPNAEWEFSRAFCDRVLLTASTSTYGWWLAFLSRGQRVYYNGRYSLPGVRKDEFSPADFWPQHWTPVHLVNSRVLEV